jgi:hypothetical protein
MQINVWGRKTLYSTKDGMWAKKTKIEEIGVSATI